jgi:hypothetical protein
LLGLLVRLHGPLHIPTTITHFQDAIMHKSKGSSGGKVDKGSSYKDCCGKPAKGMDLPPVHNVASQHADLRKAKGGKK